MKRMQKKDRTQAGEEEGGRAGETEQPVLRIQSEAPEPEVIPNVGLQREERDRKEKIASRGAFC